MRIGLRTVKTAIASVLAMYIAQWIGLHFAASAGVIAILSLAGTKKNSLHTGIERLLSLVVATLVSFCIFEWVGFSPLSFGIYLLLFIPIVVKLKLTEGIVVSSVLVTHYLTEAHFSLSLIGNEFLLMGIGAGMAVIMNLYMPDRKKELVKQQRAAEELFRALLWDLSTWPTGDQLAQLIEDSRDLMKKLHEGQKQARLYQEDHFFEEPIYFEEYFLMRSAQVRMLQDMLILQRTIAVDSALLVELKEVLAFTAQTFAEKNDGTLLLEKVEGLFLFYQRQALPKNRDEFENRARLFQFLQSFKGFIEIKSEFFDTFQHVVQK